MKKTSYLASLMIMGIFFIVYLISVILQPNNWSDVLSPINAFLAGFFIFVSFYKSNRCILINLSLLFYSFGCFSWAFADMLWAINALLLGVDPSEISAITFFYLLTNIFFASGVFLFAFYQFKRWNIAKLLLDIIIFSFAAILLVWILFFNRSNEILALLTVEGIFSVISIVIDILVYVGIVIWYLSIRGGKIPLVVRFISGGIFLFVLTDLYYYYSAYNDIYVANSLIDAIYLAALLIIAIGGLMPLYAEKKDLLTAPALSTNVGTRSKEIFILLCPILVILIRGFVLSEFLIFITLTVVYMGLNSYIQNSIKNEALLKKELQLNTELESIIAKRTNELHEANVELINKNRELHYLSNTDTLTNLYNRRYFLTDLEKRISNMTQNQTITLFYMDLDRFKLINDTYGHNIGDRVLIEISKRLAKSACDHSTIARMGGDEFVLACTSYAENDVAAEMAKTIIATCSKELYINGYIFYPALCIGISIFPNGAQTAEALIKNADIALYHAKSTGINKFAVYNSLIHDKTKKRNEIELFLRRNDFYDDLRLFYQPQFSIPDGKLSGIEALIRWVSSDNEIMTPAEFIQVAEETDHINEIGIWVLKKAVLQITDWNTRYDQNLKMGINISPKQLNSTNLLTELKQLAENNAFNPKWLDIEITESMAMDGEYRMSQIFNLFKSIGMSVSIDDFGTGYSSISYLKHFTIDRIKIAKPLIDSIVTSIKAKQIVQAIILLAKTIGINTIAEGVETKNQLDILAELGCEEIQGFYLGRPVPGAEFENLFLKDLQHSKLPVTE
nr:EAL domain-containing protein [uncultured Acetobacterium sp.]